MAKAVKASLLHIASIEHNPQHHVCLKENDSWCGYQRDSKTYKHKKVFQNPVLS